VAKGFLDFAISEQKDTGHLLDVTGRKKSEMAVKDGEDHAEDGFGMEELANGNARESEGFVEAGSGIAEAGDIGEMVVLHEVPGFLFRAHVDEGELRTAGGNRLALGGEIRNHFAAEGTAEMAEENEIDGARGNEGRKRLAVLGEKLAGKSGIDFGGEEHAGFYSAWKRPDLRLILL
jgi:hypothetical protein